MFSFNSSRNPRVVFADSAGTSGSRWSAGQNTRAPVAWRKSSDRAVIARFFHRPITPIPSRRLNHSAASPEKIGGTSVSLPRSVPARRPISERTCSRRCVQFISATAANAGRESGEYDGADHRRFPAPPRSNQRPAASCRETNKRPPKRRGDARRGLSLASERYPESSPSIPRAVPSF